MGIVRRIYVEKKTPYAVGAKELLHEIRNYLNIETIEKVRILIRYDITGICEDTYQMALGTIFHEPPVDEIFEEKFPYDNGDKIFSVEYLPGQFDQRADSAIQCIKLLSEEEPVIRTATTYVISGNCTKEEFDKIKNYCFNPVDSKIAEESKPKTLEVDLKEPEDVIYFQEFIQMNDDQLCKLYESLNLAMTFADFKQIQAYFRDEEKRNPSVTEIRVLDTYWSDHCRHTTFLTELKKVEFADGFYKEPIKKAYENYLEVRNDLYAGKKDKYISLMDIALAAMKKLKEEGKLQDMEESDEINACSIVVPVEIDGELTEWLVFFKNETHNHPTEIEPFGGAATCLGGAIRDPLSGRGYVYQAMRVTGAADPRTPIKDTLIGKLPQRKIVTTAAKGYSSYGNQIGLATGLVDEIYHPGFVAKRLEIGAVMGAAPRSNVVRKKPTPGDKIILLGGRTGRDGCGGATGSSKVHTTESIETCGAEVQKGNPPTERKLQRLFRRKEVSLLIKKCNDFGAGGVAVAIGELADGLYIDLDKVPKKYAGLDGTELAISESQERMAIVVDEKDVEQFLSYAEEENLEAVVVAEVKSKPRLIMTWRGKEIVNISREFLNTNGAHQEAEVLVVSPKESESYFKRNESKASFKEKWLSILADLNACSKKGLVEMFDSSIGASSVLMPFGGKYQLTPTQTMIAKLPVQKGNCDTVTMMSYGYNPYLSSWSPYHGAVYALISSVAKIVSSGGDYKKIRFTFQEYFKRLGTDNERWGEPFAALLGAFDAQMKLELASIGGKDSMSGTFNDIDVPPTLVSFAVNIGKVKDIVTPELKTAGHILIKTNVNKDKYDLPDYEQVKGVFAKVYEMVKECKVFSAYAVEGLGVCEALSKMAFGNKLGVKIKENISEDILFTPDFGAILLEVDKDVASYLNTQDISYEVIGEVTDEAFIEYRNDKISIDEAIVAWSKPLESVFPTHSYKDNLTLQPVLYKEKNVYVTKSKVAKPTVFIPVFPGTNCEYDSIKAFEEAGASVNYAIFKNLTASNIRESVEVFEREIKNAQILMFPGGFSAGDEPDGSGKFIATAFRNERIKEAVNDLLRKNDGLVLGICNGFQALIKLGLLPYGEITPQKPDSPTLTINAIGKHVSKMVYTKVTSNKSPWLQKATLGGVYTVPTSHGEGRFVASKEWINTLIANGQVATRYVDLDGNPTMDEEFNPNGSYEAIEGITSPDGRILGKMAHSERRGNGVALNIIGEQNQHIFESGVSYFL